MLKCRGARLGRKQWTNLVHIRAIVLDEHEAALDMRVASGLDAARHEGTLPGIERLLPLLGDGVHHGYMSMDIALVPPDKVPMKPPRVALTPAMRAMRATDVGQSPRPTLMPPPNWHDAQQAARDKVLMDVALTTVQIRLPIEFVLTSADEPALKPVSDERQRAAVERSIAVRMMHASEHARAHAIEVECDAPPVDLSFRVGVLDGSRYWPIGTLVCRAGERKVTHIRAHYTPSDAIERDAVDILFAPDESAGMCTTDIFTYWNREIIVKDVPVAGLAAARSRQTAR